MSTTISPTRLLGNITSVDHAKRHPYEIQVTNIVCLILTILGNISCNVFALVFIYKQENQRNLKDKIVAILCAINACQTLGYAVELHAAIYCETTSGVCEAAAFIICSLTYTSIGCFVALAVERGIAIVQPFRYVALFSDNRHTKWLLLPPVLGLGLGVAPLAGWGSYGRSREVSTYCGFDFEDPGVLSKSYFLAVVFIAFVVPVTVTTVTFTCILSELRRTAFETKRKYGKGSDISRASQNTVKEQGLSCLLTGLVYIVSWVPYTVVCFMFYFGSAVSVPVELLSIYLSKSSTISSPIIYCLIERRFRSFVKETARRSSIQLKPMLS